MSFYRAVHSNRWVSAHGEEANDVPFSVDSVLKFVAPIMRMEAGWRRWFEKQGITPLRLRYRDLVVDLPGAVRQVLDRMGETAPRDLEAPSMRRQSGAVTDEWIRRLRSALWPLSLKVPTRLGLVLDWRRPQRTQDLLAGVLRSLESHSHVGMVVWVPPEQGLEVPEVMARILSICRATGGTLPPMEMESRSLGGGLLQRFLLGLDAVCTDDSNQIVEPVAVPVLRGEAEVAQWVQLVCS